LDLALGNPGGSASSSGVTAQPRSAPLDAGRFAGVGLPAVQREAEAGDHVEQELAIAEDAFSEVSSYLACTAAQMVGHAWVVANAVGAIYSRLT
jgi:hypothetical protein